MRKLLTIFFLSLILILPTQLLAESTLTLKPGQHVENGDIMLYFSPIPLTKSPDDVYGRQGDKTKPDKVLEDIGLAIYDTLKAIKTSKGWPALRTVVIEFDRITLEKYKWTEYDDIREKILGAFALTTNPPKSTPKKTEKKSE